MYSMCRWDVISKPSRKEASAVLSGCNVKISGSVGLSFQDIWRQKEGFKFESNSVYEE